MRLSSIVPVGLFLVLCSTPSTAQRPAPPTPPPPIIRGPSLGELNQLFATLSNQKATHSGVTFDRSMVQIAQSVLESGGLSANRAAAAITGISFDTYRYQQPAFYTPEAMTNLIGIYHAAGWKHLVDGKQTPASTAQPRAMVTDLWLHFSGTEIDSVTVLSRAPLNMSVIQITGALRPLDLLHLAGHFGIPKVDPDAVMVPDPQY